MIGGTKNSVLIRYLFKIVRMGIGKAFGDVLLN